MKSVEIKSGEPWNLTCTVTAERSDILCRIHGGDDHVRAVARAQWTGDRSRTRILSGKRKRQSEIAAHAAHRLSRACRSTVVCSCAIHFDDVTADQIEDISATALGLATRAARSMEDSRLAAKAASDPLVARIENGADERAAEIDSFLDTPWSALMERHRASVMASFRKHFGSRVRLFAPLYVSNACVNNCVYCGFRHGARFTRRTLDAFQALNEARAMASTGFRTIDLVSGEVPTDRFVDYVADLTKTILASTEISVIHLNVGSLSREQYVRLRQAGAVGYHLYQECYGRDEYFAVHGSGQKRDMAARIGGLHRVAEAGFDTVGLGILLGLAPVARELARLVRHAEILQEDYPRLRVSFSLPRIQQVDEGCSYRPEAVISDDDFRKAMLFLRLRFPSAGLTLTTRESAAIRDSLLPLGVSRLSAEVSTAPGGYADAEGQQTRQFEVADVRTVGEVEESIRTAHLTPSFT